MDFMSLAKIALVLGFLLFGAPVSGSTLHVEKDGSGDFLTIQAAVDAAVDGDIIQIGVGRFDDFITDPQWGDFRVWVHGDKSLTFLGSGPESTIIGPEEYDNLYRGWGIYCDAGPITIRIEGIRFENLDRHAVTTSCDYFEIENCVFEHCRMSCSPVGGQSAIIENCQFFNSLEGHTLAIWCRTPHVLVSDVSVQNCYGGIQCDYGGTNDILITNCTFNGGGEGRDGVYFDHVGGNVVGCHFSNLTSVGFTCSSGKNISLRDNVFEGIRNPGSWPGMAIALYGGESFLAQDNIISSSDICFYAGNPFQSFAMNNNHLFRSEPDDGYFIKTNNEWTYWEEHWDFTNNFWGTTDPDEISQWIFDGNDSAVTTMFVDFLPMADGPVSTEQTTLDQVKAMYR